ncbi:MAG TPA: hypothetical protein VKX49_12845 [Bryobacteraceae bacterium]|nr:hypothetical protein [Bryobacteraceae bacterium]
MAALYDILGVLLIWLELVVTITITGVCIVEAPLSKSARVAVRGATVILGLIGTFGALVWAVGWLAEKLK